RDRRGPVPARELTNGPGKLTTALGIWLDLNGVDLTGGPIEVLPRDPADREPRVVVGRRIGITKAVELPWRFCDATSRDVSPPWPEAMRRRARRPAAALR